MKSIGEITPRVLKRVKKGAFISRWARRMAKRSRMNWRRNGLRPRGRGYDWARTLIAEELLKHADTNAGAPVEIKAADLAGAVGCSVRIARREVVRLEQQGCLVRLGRARGRGAGLMLELRPVPIAARVLARAHRYSAPKARGPQLPLALKLRTPVDVPADILAITDRMAKLAAARGRIETGEIIAKNTAERSSVPVQEKVDPSLLHTSTQPSDTASSAPAGAGGGRSASRLRIIIGGAEGEVLVKPDLARLREEWRAIENLDRTGQEAFPDPLRRRMQRHLRMCCWYRGCDPATSRRICAAVGWWAATIGKSAKRKYFLIDAISWVMSSDVKRLAYSSSSWPRMQLSIRSGFPRNFRSTA